MSQKLAPRQILQKNHVSQHEHNPREGQATDPTKNNEVAPRRPRSKPPAQQKQQEQKQWQADPAPDRAPYFAPEAEIQSSTPEERQGPGPNRRVQVRSSSLFEEWKAKALREPVEDKIKGKRAGVSVADEAKTENNKAEGSAASVGTRGRASRGAQSDKGATARTRNKSANGTRGRQSEASKTLRGAPSVAVGLKDCSKGPSSEATASPVRAKLGNQVRGRQSEAVKPFEGTTSGIVEARGRSRELSEKAARVPLKTKPAVEVRDQQPQTRETPNNATHEAATATECSKRASAESSTSQARTNPASVARGRQPGTSRFQQSAGCGDVRVALGEIFDKPTTNRQKNKPTDDSRGLQRSTSKVQESVVSEDAGVALGEYPDKTGNAQAKISNASNTSGQQAAAGKTRNVSKESLRLAATPSTSVPANHPATSTRGTMPAQELSPQELTESKRHGEARRLSRERMRPLLRQKSLERQVHTRARSWEQLAYEAPNGTQSNTDEMRTLALGLKLENNDKVYFLPCFVEDPWKGLEPVLAIRPPNLMNRF